MDPLDTETSSAQAAELVQLITLNSLLHNSSKLSFTNKI